MNKVMRGLGQLTNQPGLGLHIDNLQNQQIAVKYYTVGAWLNILSNCLMQTRIILKHLKHDMRDFASYKKDDFFSLKSKKWWQSHHTMPRHFFHLHCSGQLSEMSPLRFFPAQVIMQNVSGTVYSNHTSTCQKENFFVNSSHKYSTWPVYQVTIQVNVGTFFQRAPLTSPQPQYQQLKRALIFCSKQSSILTSV